MDTNSQLLVALKSQSSSSYMIQFFVMIAVALGIASVLIVSVVQKKKEIAILLAFGTARRQIVKIFLYQGAIVGFTGSVIGAFMGTGLAMFFRSISSNPDGSPQFPIEIEPAAYVVMILISTMVGLISAAMPARQAAMVDPATVIH
jgi:lipoprotein-releasing system permease protein